MSEKLITVAEFGSPIEAHLVRIRLEEEGIECFIADEYIPLWFAPIGTGDFSVKLQVQESDKDMALQILQKQQPDTNSDADSIKDAK
ncbi:MAG: DUF2007 domain-containing protein [Planctomycetota bacterium]